MAVPGFLNENANRTYPFVENPLASGLPEETVVDGGLLLGPDAAFLDGVHSVWLAQAHCSLDGTQLTLAFASDAPALAGSLLSFAVLLPATEFTSWPSGETSSSSASSLPAPCAGGAPLWEGFLVTGNPATLADQLGMGGSRGYAQGEWTLEPARVQNLGRSAVRAVHLANGDRTRAGPPAGCPGAVPVLRPPFVTARCLEGPVWLRAGYNTLLAQSSADNAVTLAASPGSGAGPACEEVPLGPGDSPPAGSSLLTGGPACDELIVSLNGLPGPHVPLVAGSGVTIVAGPGPHELTVAVDLHGQAVCVPAGSSL